MVRSVTSGNKKATEFHLRCAATGLYLSQATQDFEVISVTHKASRAVAFPCGESVEFCRRMMRAFYGSFDWTPVAVEA